MSILEFQNRRYDLFGFSGAQAAGDVQLEQELFSADNSGQVCTGIQKLAQRFILELMTEDGSLQYLPDRGCAFMREARQGRLRTETDAAVSFNFALIDVGRSLQSEEDNTWEDEERFASADLLSLTLADGQLTARVQITSLSGDSRRVILPIPVLP